jgi:hypothetical protein
MAKKTFTDIGDDSRLYMAEARGGRFPAPQDRG